MIKNLFVGNLKHNVTELQLVQLFSKFGVVLGVNVLEKCGFGFVKMATDLGTLKAIEGLNQTEFEGQRLFVDEFRSKTIKFSWMGGKSNEIDKKVKIKWNQAES